MSTMAITQGKNPAAAKMNASASPAVRVSEATSGVWKSLPGHTVEIAIAPSDNAQNPATEYNSSRVRDKAAAARNANSAVPAKQTAAEILRNAMKRPALTAFGIQRRNPHSMLLTTRKRTIPGPAGTRESGMLARTSFQNPANSRTRWPVPLALSPWVGLNVHPPADFAQ